MKLSLLAMLFLSSFISNQALARNIIGQASVVDGDTIEIHGERIRLWGIDAIEGAQLCWERSGAVRRCGRDFAIALSDRIGRHTISCEQVSTDRYGRPVAICEVAGIDLGDWLVRNGFAIDYVKYSNGVYADAQNQARENAAGNWKYSWQYPENYRACMKTKGGKIRRCSEQ